MQMANGRSTSAPFYPNGRATAISVTGHNFLPISIAEWSISGGLFRNNERLPPAFNQLRENEQADFSTCPYCH